MVSQQQVNELGHERNAQPVRTACIFAEAAGSLATNGVVFTAMCWILSNRQIGFPAP